MTDTIRRAAKHISEHDEQVAVDVRADSGYNWGMKTFYETYKDNIVISESGCWIWTGVMSGEYGKIKQEYAHRISAQMTYGEIPSKMDVCHHCDNPPCVNPDHLFIGTRKDNVLDMVKKGRHAARKSLDYFLRGDNHWTHIHPEKLARGNKNGAYTHPEKIARGEEHGNAKFTNEEISLIRQKYDTGKFSQRQLAKEYKVSQGTIGFILRGETWK